MKIKFFSVFVFSFLLAGCVTTEMPADTQHYNPETSARIRLFGQNGKPTIMTVQIGQGSDAKTEKVNVGGGIGDAFGSLLGMSKNDSIGIPATANTQNLSAQNGILSKAFYREFVIPAGKPVKVNNAYIGLGSITQLAQGGTLYFHEGDCASNVVRFTPQAGHDYEVGSYLNSNGCSVVIFNIKTTNGKVSLVPIQTQ
ncbi:hypothetical protein [Bordetella sp. FB-8]|uniref:hypothetical protein n=1 Tax=Bordetella sp. FB-8 TaxID=1159870 RepID=UPI00068748D8|nr:hypothetical protein [Bordetella sp. FB-8]